MKILLFLLHTKYNFFLKKMKSSISAILNIFFTLLILLHAYAYSNFLDNVSSSKPLTDLPLLVRFLLYVILCAPTVLMFFSSLKNKTIIFKPFDPVSKLKQLYIEVIYNFFSSLYFFIGLAIFFIFIFSERFTIYHTGLAFLALFTSSVLKLFIQDCLTTGRTKLYLNIGVLSTTMLFLFFLNNTLTFQLFNLLLTPILLVIYGSYKYIGLYPLPVVKNSKIEFKSLLRILINIYFRNKPIIVNFTISFIIKFAFVFMFYAKFTQHSPPGFKYFNYIVLSSSFWFTYIHNNIFGYLKTTYKTLAVTKDLILLFRVYLLLLIAPIVVDIIISFSIVTIYSSLTFSAVGFYIASLLINICIGFYASLQSPFEVKTALNFSGAKSNTPIQYSFLLAFITGLLSFLYVNISWMYITPVPIVASGYLLYLYIYKGKVRISINNIFNKL